MNFLTKFFATTKNDVQCFQDLQQRIEEKNKFFESIYNNMVNFNKTLKSFYEKLERNSKDIDDISYSLEDQYLYDAFKLFQIRVVKNLKNEYEFAKNNLKMLENHLGEYKAEMNIYDELKNIRKNLEKEKLELKDNKDGYHKAGIDMENKVKKFVESNLDDMDNLSEPLNYQLVGFVKNPKKLLKKYKENIEDVNKLAYDFNKKQDNLSSLLPYFGNEDNEFFTKLVKNFLDTLQKNYEFLDSTKDSMSIIQKNVRKDDLNNLIKEALDNKTEEKRAELIQYQSGLEFIKCKNRNEFEFTAKVIETINKIMEDNIFPNYNYKADLNNFLESKLIKKLFEMKEIDENSEKELLNSLDDKMNHKAMFIVLSQLRTNSTFNRPKSFIKVFGKAFNKMIYMANKEEIYEYVKNCIILSQTYFYNDEEEKDKKRYLFEEIKSNKILNNSHFWRNFIDLMIKTEYQRFKVNHAYPDYKIENLESVPNKIKNKLNEIVFSQLVSFLTNLNDFEIDKRVILKITDEFINKYNFLSDSNKESIYYVISTENEVIEKLRKEYDPSLESEIIEIKDEKNTKEKKEENKEEIKNDDWTNLEHDEIKTDNQKETENKNDN